MTAVTQEAISREELRSLLLQYRGQNWRGIQTAEMQATIVEQILQDDGSYVLNQVQRLYQLPANCRILDVGSGVGSFVLGCRARGLRAFGIEPDRIGQGSKLSSLRIARQRTKEQIFVAGTGEDLPFPDHTFDLVTLNQVIEHVRDQGACVREAFRVLKPGGAMYVACPNYLRFYEPHYKIAWLPLMPRSLARMYLRLRGRNPVMLDQLTYTTGGRLGRLLGTLAPEGGVVDLNAQQFIAKRDAGSFVSGKYKLLARLTRIPLLGEILLHCVLFVLRIRQGGCEVLVLRRNKP